LQPRQLAEGGVIPAPTKAILMLVCAAIFSFVSFLMDFGWGAVLASALVGAASGYSISRGFIGARAATSGSNQQVDRLGSKRVLLSAYNSPIRSGGSGNRRFFVLLGPFFDLPLYQRLASLAFLLQSAVSLLAIVVFCAAEMAGLDVRFLHAPSLARLFADAFPMAKGAAIAKIRFDNLFLPLVSLYVISLASFAAALLHSLGPILRDIGKQKRLVVANLFFLLGLWLLFFTGGSAGTRSVQKCVIEGSAWGYIVLFVFCPIVGMFLASELPNDR
jgi:hypothetical protein